MAFTDLPDLDCQKTITLGGKDKKTNKTNPTQIEGYYLGSRQVASKKSNTGFTNLHIFQTQEGNVGVWGKTNLDSKLRSVVPGAMTRATFVGMVETNHNPMYKYRVSVDLENTIDVSAIATEDQTDTAQVSDSSDTTNEEYESESDLSDDEVPTDEVKSARLTSSVSKPPVASMPSAERQAKVRALLAGKKSAVA